MGEEGGGSAIIEPESAGRRLDLFLSEVAGLSRTRAQALIERGLVSVDGGPAKKNHLVSLGETVTWAVPCEETFVVTPQEIPLNLVHEDEHVIVVDKPAGMVMYPGHGHARDTLANALLSVAPEMAGVGNPARPGIVHRLDRGTSGLVAVARTQEAYLGMVEMIAERRVTRGYTALVSGELPASSGTIDAPVGRSEHDRKKMAVRPSAGREAVTVFTVSERFDAGYTLVEVFLETGRTHQVRVHFAHIGHPVAGDPDYSRGRGRRELGLERQFLHASRLSFDHPVTGDHIDLRSELPADLAAALQLLRSGARAGS